MMLVLDCLGFRLMALFLQDPDTLLASCICEVVDMSARNQQRAWLFVQVVAQIHSDAPDKTIDR